VSVTTKRRQCSVCGVSWKLPLPNFGTTECNFRLNFQLGSRKPLEKFLYRRERGSRSVSHFKTRATLHTFDKSLKFCVYFCRSGADPQFPIAPSLTLWRNCVSISGEKGYTNFFRYTPCVPIFEFLPHSLPSPSTSGTSPSFSSTLQFLLISPVFKYPLHPQIYHGRYQVDGNHPPLYDAMIMLIRSLSSCVRMLAQLERNVVS
jgi:hypothetical protein